MSKHALQLHTSFIVEDNFGFICNGIFLRLPHSQYWVIRSTCVLRYVLLPDREEVWPCRTCMHGLHGVIYSFFDRLSHSRGYSSVVEHSTADREVHGSTPCAPLTNIFASWNNFLWMTWIEINKLPLYLDVSYLKVGIMSVLILTTSSNGTMVPLSKRTGLFNQSLDNKLT